VKEKEKEKKREGEKERERASERAGGTMLFHPSKCTSSHPFFCKMGGTMRILSAQRVSNVWQRESVCTCMSESERDTVG